MISEPGKLERFLHWCRSTPAGVMLGVLVVSALCALLAYPQAWTVFAATATLLLVGITLPGLTISFVRATAEFSAARCRIGEEVVLRVELVNRLPFPAAGIELRGLDVPVPGLITIPARSRRVLDIPLTPRRRGVWPRTRLSLVCGYPLGLRQAARLLEPQSVLLVWPKEAPVNLPDLGSSPRLGDSVLAGRRSGNFGEPTGVRPYRRGDAIREVHWRQTARHGRLIVRERQSPASSRALLILDSDPAAYDNDDHREHAIAIAAGLLLGFSQTGVLVDLLVGTDFVPAGSSGSRSGAASPVSAALDQLARVTDETPGLSESLLQVTSTSADAVVVTSPRTAGRLRGALPRSAQWIEVPAVEPAAATAGAR